MTTLAAYDDGDCIALAADRRSSGNGYNNVNGEVCKIVGAGDGYAGMAGDAEACLLLSGWIARHPGGWGGCEEIGDTLCSAYESWGVNAREQAFLTDPDKDFPTLLLIQPCGIYRVSERVLVQRFNRFCSVGSGSYHALGALSALHQHTPGIAAEAAASYSIEVAARFCQRTGDGVDCVSIKKQRRLK